MCQIIVKMKRKKHLAESNIMKLFLHNAFHWLLLFECDEAKASPFVRFSLHGKFNRLHLFRLTVNIRIFVVV